MDTMILADLKRLKEGSSLKIIFSLFNHKNLNIERKIEKKQSNSIRFEGGSWLYYPEARMFKGLSNNTFSILDVKTDQTKVEEIIIKGIEEGKYALLNKDITDEETTINYKDNKYIIKIKELNDLFWKVKEENKEELIEVLRYEVVEAK